MAKWALCVGINNYPGTEMDLRGCVNDARDWAKAFCDRDFTIKFLLDKQATGKSIKEGINKLLDDSKSGDIVAIQYSGHGSYVPDEDGDESDGTDECLCPYDIRSNGPITDDELREIYKGVKEGVKVVMFSDSCNSGTVIKYSTEFMINKKNYLLISTKAKFLSPSTFLSKQELCKLRSLRRSIRLSGSISRYGVLLMAGCQDTEYSIDGNFYGRPNGVFTYTALRTLRHISENASYLDWYKAIRKILPSQQYPQTPNLYGFKESKKWKIL